MKTKNLILILLLIVQVVKGQCFDTSSNWTLITTNVFDSTLCEISTFKVDGDTLINDISYFKVFVDNNFYCALRETDDYKIYNYFLDNQEELLIYDFDWVEGKELKFQYYEEPETYQTYATISQIDSVKLLDNTYYKCLKSDDEIFCIHGIGDLNGFFSFIFPSAPNGDKSSLLCFYRGEQLIYCNSDYNDCEITSIDDKNISSDKNVRVYPVPSNGNVIIELLDNDFIDAESICIYNEAGELIKSIRINGTRIITINQLTVGTYVYQITFQNGQKISGKIIITK